MCAHRRGARENHGVFRFKNLGGREFFGNNVRELALRHLAQKGLCPRRHLHFGNVHGQVDVRCPRPLALRILKRQAHDLVDGVGAHDELCAPRDGFEHFRQIEELVRRDVHAVGRHLARNRDERRAIALRVRHARHQVRRPRPQGCQAYAGFPRQAAVHVGHERRALFVARRDEPDLFGMIDRIDHREVLLPRDAEHVLDALIFQAFYKKFCCVHERFPRSQTVISAHMFPPRARAPSLCPRQTAA